MANDKLAVAAADGSKRQVLDDEQAVPVPFQWSPDATRIAFWTQQRLRVVPATGGRATDLASGVTDALWSPDGTRIAYLSDHLWVVPATGGTPVMVATGGIEPSWSPDSQELAYADPCTAITNISPPPGQSSSTCSGNSYIHIVSADGKTNRTLSYSHNGTLVADHPMWSPSGPWLLFQARPGNAESGAELELVHDDGSARREVGPGSGIWSPDGNGFVFKMAGSNHQSTMYWGTPSDTALLRLGGGVIGSCLAISPTAHEVLYEADTLGGPNETVVAHQLRVVEADGSGRDTFVTNDLCATDGPGEWSPDGSAIAIEAGHFGAVGVHRSGQWTIPDDPGRYHGGGAFSPR